MIKLIREAAIERPWFYKIIMFIVAVAFVISMGWWGFSDSEQPYVARVDEETIAFEEFGQAYARAARLYQDLLSENFKEETIKRFVLDSMVERLLWLKAAGDLGLEVSAQELAEVVVRDESFKKDGKFDPKLYRDLLARNRTSPERYERAIREDLLIEKAKNLVRDGVLLTPGEIEAATAGLKSGPADKQTEMQDQAIKNALFQKRQRMLLAYIGGIRSSSQVEIKYQML
jgi:peptidyl-prolyl cis-trans isomerase D